MLQWVRWDHQGWLEYELDRSKHRAKELAALKHCIMLTYKNLIYLTFFLIAKQVANAINATAIEAYA